MHKLLYFILAFLTAYSAQNIAIKKGRNSSAWFFICLFFPPSIFILLLLDDSEEKIHKENRKCPYCAELIKREAIICKHCKKKIAPLPVFQEEQYTQRKTVKRYIKCPHCSEFIPAESTRCKFCEKNIRNKNI